ncbi:MAG: ABC transporter permease [Clostridiales bacterium]|nr:ABC transporter permease [Clostridiales bacterium]
MSFASTIISSVLGIAAGLWLERHKFPGKRLIVRVNRTLMGMPSVVVGLITYMLLMRRGPLGFLNWLFTIQGMVVAQVIIITPIICGMVFTNAERIAPAIRMFAKNMGANRSQTNRLLLREMRNEMYFAVVTGIGRSISEVGAVLKVGGHIKNSTRTMTTAISTLKSAGIFTDGIVLGFLLLVMAFIIQTVADRLRKQVSYDENY